jgi:hypothetical protein
MVSAESRRLEFQFRLLGVKPGLLRQWAGMGEEKKPRSLEACKLYGRTCLGFLLGTPIAQAQELPNLSAFVAIFLGFGRSIVGLAEGMFGIADCLLNQVQRLSHTQFPSFHDGTTALLRRRLQ